MELYKSLLCLCCSCIYCRNQADREHFVFLWWRLAPSIETMVGQRGPCSPSGVHKSLEGMTKETTNTQKGHPQKNNEHTLPLADLESRYVKMLTVTNSTHICSSNWSETNKFSAWVRLWLLYLFALSVDICCTHMEFHRHGMHPNQRGNDDPTKVL